MKHNQTPVFNNFIVLSIFCASIFSNNILAGDISQDNTKLPSTLVESYTNPLLKIHQKITIDSFESLRQSISIFKAAPVTIVFMDIDNTLIKPFFWTLCLSIEDRNIKVSEFFRRDREKIDFNEYKELREFLTFLDSNQRIYGRLPTEASVLDFIHDLNNEKVILVGLTARDMKYHKTTYKNLLKLGIDFIELSYLKDLEIIVNENSLLRKGIFYTGNHGKKIEYIPFLVDNITEYLGINGPVAVFHIDDNENEIRAFSGYNIQRWQGNQPMQIWPIHYKKCEKLINRIISDPKIARLLDDEIKALYDMFKNSQKLE